MFDKNDKKESDEILEVHWSDGSDESDEDEEDFALVDLDARNSQVSSSASSIFLFF